MTATSVPFPYQPQFTGLATAKGNRLCFTFPLLCFLSPAPLPDPKGAQSGKTRKLKPKKSAQVFSLPPPLPGPLGFQKSRKSKRGKEKSGSLLNRIQGWMCPASQQARPGKQGLRLTQQAGQLCDPAARPGPQPPAGSGALSPPPSGQPQPGGKEGTRRGARATLGH